MLLWMYMVDNNSYFNLVNLLRGGGGGWCWVVGNKLCLTLLEKQSVMMNSFHQTE